MISEIAAHWGFWHLGMFSSYYKDLFGETPSATARRAISH
jgi:AraC family ethanolamine operon transcriptional activator